MPTITLEKLVVHTDETVKQQTTTLKPGNVECVFAIDKAGGQGINFASVGDMKEWLHKQGFTDDVEGSIKAVLIEVEKADPTFGDTSAVQGKEFDAKVELTETAKP